MLLEDFYLKVSWFSACTFSGKDVGANDSFMVLFEQKQLEVYNYRGEYTGGLEVSSQLALTQPV